MVDAAAVVAFCARVFHGKENQRHSLLTVGGRAATVRDGGTEGGATATTEALPPFLSSSVFGSPGLLVVWQISLGFLLRHLTVGGPLPRDVRS